ncbi:hypothetical protein C2S51_023718 [Perilla frutescens var. frutescens]|nr:hypothetical protein C2S51_023718 [Perilla frutescens var. frutescens]
MKKGFKKIHLLQLLLFLNILFQASASEEIRVSYCGSIKIQEPFFHQNSSHSSLLSQMIICKSEKLYFRTSIGLFVVNSIDYMSKLITVSHSSCSSASHFVSPQHLSAGFPSPASSNSLILMNCSNRSSEIPLVPCNSTVLSGRCDSSATKKVPSCLVIDDAQKLEKSFDPKQMDCTHYSRVYARGEKFVLGTRISFDIPDHVPNPCNECEKPDGNCGVGLRCACHPKECKDKVTGAALRPNCGNMLVYLVFVVVVIVLLHGF